MIDTAENGPFKCAPLSGYMGSQRCSWRGGQLGSELWSEVKGIANFGDDEEARKMSFFFLRLIHVLFHSKTDCGARARYKKELRSEIAASSTARRVGGSNHVL